MNWDTIGTWITAAFGVALVTTIVMHKESAKVVSAFANGLASTIRAAIGK